MNKSKGSVGGDERDWDDYLNEPGVSDKGDADTQGEVFNILEKVYEQGVYEADEVRYDAMDESNKGERLTLSEAVKQLQALIATKTNEARIDELTRLHLNHGQFEDILNRLTELNNTNKGVEE